MNKNNNFDFIKNPEKRARIEKHYKDRLYKVLENSMKTHPLTITEIIDQLKSLLDDHIEWCEEIDDVFDKDCKALYKCILLLEEMNYE